MLAGFNFNTIEGLSVKNKLQLGQTFDLKTWRAAELIFPILDCSNGGEERLIAA